MSKSGKKYGSEYTTVYQSGNIKFVKPNAGSTTAPMETMTKNRVYVTLDYKNEPKLYLITIKKTRGISRLTLMCLIKVCCHIRIMDIIIMRMMVQKVRQILRQKKKEWLST